MPWWTRTSRLLRRESWRSIPHFWLEASKLWLIDGKAVLCCELEKPGDGCGPAEEGVTEVSGVNGALSEPDSLFGDGWDELRYDMVLAE